MKIISLSVLDLSNDPANARKHNERNIEAIIASLRRFGQQKPIVIDKSNVVRAGNGTLEAARRLGWDKIDCVVTNLESSDATAYAIADNRTAELAEWNSEILAAELESLQSDGLLEAAGFTDEELAEMLQANQPEPEITEDEVPETPADPITQPGDLWLLGKHRLLCGDSTKAEDVERLMAGAKAGMMVTDPPYGVEYDPSWRAEVNDDGPNSKRAVGKVANDDRADWTEAWQLFEGDVAYVWHADRYSPVVAGSLEATGLEVRYLIIWAKQRHTFGRGHYHHQHEPCWCVVRKGATASWAGDRTQTTLWQIDNNRHNDTGHGTQKPVECMARPIRNHEAELIYDPFLGSGTTLIAAEQLGRKCYGMEISPAYCDVIVKRWETLTGQKATCQSATLAS